MSCLIIGVMMSFLLDYRGQTLRSCIPDTSSQLNTDLRNYPYLELTLDTVPSPLFVVNSEDQIVYANTAMISYSSAVTLYEMINRYPGEVLKCAKFKANSIEEYAHADTCDDCAISKAIRNSNNNGSKFYESDFYRSHLMLESTLDLQTKSIPIEFNDISFTLIIINDLTSKKRRQDLSRIFFHDVLITSNAIHSFIRLINQNLDIVDYNPRAEKVLHTTQSQFDELWPQRQMLAAVNNELETNLEIVDLSRFLFEFFIGFKSDPEWHGDVKLLTPDIDYSIATDEEILKRVLEEVLSNIINLAGNNNEINVKVTRKNLDIIFEIFSKTFIPANKQLSLFFDPNFDFSSFNDIQTYNIQVLVENYLIGHTNIKSEPGKGTCFFLTLPTSIIV